MSILNNSPTLKLFKMFHNTKSESMACSTNQSSHDKSTKYYFFFRSSVLFYFDRFDKWSPGRSQLAGVDILCLIGEDVR